MNRGEGVVKLGDLQKDLAGKIDRINDGRLVGTKEQHRIYEQAFPRRRYSCSRLVLVIQAIR